jgi:hypothetical protein
VLSPGTRAGGRTVGGQKLEPATPARQTAGLSSQERPLEKELKLAHWTDRLREGRLEVHDRLEERILVSAVGRRSSSA